MIFRYRIEYEFEAENMDLAQEALNKGLVTQENMTLKTLEAVCLDDRIVPKKWVPKSVEKVHVEYEQILKPYASEIGEEPENDQLEHSGDDTRGTSPEPSHSRINEESGKIEEEDIPF